MASPTSLQSGATSKPHGRKLALPASATAIEALIEQYSAGLDPLPKKAGPPAILQGPLVVLLTGSTGNLGSEILVDLLKNDRVDRVYAFNRPSKRGDPIEKRQIKAFNERRLDTDILRSTKLSYVLGDATLPNLGINPDQYALLTGSVNVVIHNAWQVSFTGALKEFEPHIQATRHLADFLKGGPHAAHARFLFTSSITSAQSWLPSKGPYPEEIVTEPSVAVGGAYGASKYVAERILAKSGLQMTTFRIGQICGGAPDGVWDTTEWVPILLKSSIALKFLPESPGLLSWIPMNTVAAAIVEAASSREALPEAVNLVHPQAVSGETIVSYLTSAIKELLGVQLDLIPLKLWVSKVERLSANATADTMRDIPAIMLLDFLRDVSKGFDRILTTKVIAESYIPSFATQRMCSISPRTMNALQPICKKDVEMWIKYWQEVNYLTKIKSHL
ncbi:hypothetical protein H0H93_006990 [Arthromyces matolae]|nr:hypothetical protein H0H93_006990 [Arthromyces matolae]